MAYIGQAYVSGPSGRAGPLIKGSEYLGNIRKVREGTYRIDGRDDLGELPTSAFMACGSTDPGYARERYYALHA